MRRPFGYLVAVAALAATFITGAPMSVAASGPSSLTPAEAAQAQVSTAEAATDGYFLVWNGDNGSRCDFLGNAPTLGSCTNKNYLLFNDGLPCSGCDWIRLYWGSNYTGAYFCIAPGAIYGQPTSPGLTFNKGAGLAGYGESIWYNAASARWSGAC